MKAWRLQPCPRNAKGRKVKGANRRDKDAGAFVLPSGMSDLLRRLFSLGDVERTAKQRLDRLVAEKKARLRG